MTLTEVAAATGLSRAAARRFLLTFVADGYAQTDGKRFWLTPKTLELGFAYLSSVWFWERAQTILTEVTRQTRESCSAGVLDGDDVVYVARVAANRIMTVNLRIGSRLPALFTSMGRVIVADLPEPDIAKMLEAGPFPALTDATLTNPIQVRAALRAAQTQGWAIVDQELEAGLISIAVPLRTRVGCVAGAINVSSHASRADAKMLQRDVLPILRAAVEGIGVAP